MNLKAKFRVDQVTSHRGTRLVKDKAGQDITEEARMKTVILRPIDTRDPKHDNRKVWPGYCGGVIELTCLTDEAAAVFVEDAEVTVTFASP